MVQPLLPPPPPHKTPAGRKRLDERRIFTGIVFILQSGMPWEMLPREMGCGSGMTCWRRARDWQQAGVRDKLHRVLLAKLRNAERLDFSRVIADSSSVRTVMNVGMTCRKDFSDSVVQSFAGEPFAMSRTTRSHFVRRPKH
jgi:transposase